MPTLTSSAQAWFVMVVTFTLMGIGFLIQGKVRKSWLKHLYQNNLAIFTGWVGMGILSVNSLRTYEQFGSTIESLQEPNPTDED